MKVIIYDIEKSISALKAIKFIRYHMNISLREAKDIVDSFRKFDGNETKFINEVILDVKEPYIFITNLLNCGVLAKIERKHKINIILNSLNEG